jgi:4-hydroxyphenylpyruvate dioxygenase
VSVCALALEVEDASLSIARAESYGLHQYIGKIGSKEHLLPAVRGEEGGLFYFTDTLTQTAGFESDFHVTHAVTGEEAFDHIAFSLPEGQMESFVLFYRAILGLSPEETFVLTDPMGIVRSKAMSNASKSIRLPLNISESRHTATARSVQTFSGAGVHHIAIHTPDIFARAKEMQANGAAILQIHENYYADLASKYDLDEETIEEMKNLNILYDKIGDAECFHLYTLPFEGRFFMEFIERRQGYQAYAQANAGMRMSSLALSQNKMFEGL